MAAWQLLFSESVFIRGIDLWEAGAVGEIERKNDGTYSAIVHGGDDYLVSVVKDGDSFGELECDCPYGDDGGYCKHMVALLLELEDSEDSSFTEVEKPSSTKTSLDEVINQLPDDIVRQELLNAAKKDELLSARLTAMVDNSFTSDDGSVPENHEWSDFVDVLHTRIDTIIRNCTDRYDFIDWRNGIKFVEEIEEKVIHEVQEALVDAEAFYAAMDVVIYLCESFADVDMDGSSGEHEMLTSSLDRLWDGIFEIADESQRQQMYEAMLSLYEKVKPLEESLADSLYSFMEINFDETILFQKQLGIVEHELVLAEEAYRDEADKRSKRSGYATTFVPSPFALASLVREKISLQIALQYDQSDVDELINRYRWLPEIRKIEMDRLESEGNLQDLIALLQESKETDKSYRGLVSSYSRRLIDCYQKMGLSDEAHNEAYRNATEYSPADLDSFTTLKKFYSTDQWEIERDEVFRAIDASGNRYDMNKLYREEGMYDRIIENLEKSAERAGYHRQISLREVHEYEMVLRPTYDKRLLELFEKVARTAAAPASDRSGYQAIVSILKRMLRYPNGQETVESMLAEWREKYKNRPAMQDELRKLRLES